VFKPLPVGWIARLVSLGAAAGDDDTTRLQKGLLVVGSVLISLASLLWGAIYIFFREVPAAAISLGYAAITLVSLSVYSLNHRHQPFLTSQLLLGLLCPSLQMVALGGFASSGAVNLWSLIIPLGTLLLYDARQALLWWGVYFIILLAGGFLQPYLPGTNNLPPLLVTILFVMNIAVISAIVYVILNYFIHQKDEAYRLLRIEEEKAQRLLLNVLPRDIAAILKNGHRTIAEQFAGASILFADLVGFTPLTASLAPVEMVNLLNQIFSHFDSLVDKYDLEKIRTIGDNYMVAAGVPRPRPDHAAILARLALDMRDYIEKLPTQAGRRIQFRIGLNSGPVVGGVIGRQKFHYDVWGDAVNIASRMESHGLPNQIQLTAATHALIKDQYECQPRVPIEVKGKGVVEAYLLVGPRLTSAPAEAVSAPAESE
jgi:adenylate cyclase